MVDGHCGWQKPGQTVQRLKETPGAQSSLVLVQKEPPQAGRIMPGLHWLAKGMRGTELLSP